MMAITANDLKQMQRDIATLKKQVAQLTRRKNGKPRVQANKRKAAARPTRAPRFETIRRAARRNALTEDAAMALALQAQRADD